MRRWWSDRRSPTSAGAARPRRARRRDGRRAHPRVRSAGHRRKLLLLHRAARRRPPPRVPVAEIARRRLSGDHQAPRHRWSGHRGDGHRATALRDRPACVRSGRTWSRCSTRSRCVRRTEQGRGSTGVRGAAPPDTLKVGVEHPRRPPQRDVVRPVWTRHRGEGVPGTGAARGRHRQGWTDLAAGPDRPRRRGDRGVRVRAADRPHP